MTKRLAWFCRAEARLAATKRAFMKHWRPDYVPDWVAGISIGAINAAIIAGNRPENRLSVVQFLECEPIAFRAWWGTGSLAAKNKRADSAHVRPAWLFRCAPAPGLVLPDKLISYYDTTVLKGTLERLVDFDRINNPNEIRLSVGAVNVRTGQFAYFDSATNTIWPEHIMASSALPPGFPPIEIDGEHYWDGGLFSNTPLQYVLDYSPRRSRLTFQVDLFQARKVGFPAISMRSTNAIRIYATQAGHRSVR